MGTKFRASCKNQSWLTKYIINSKTILGGVQYEVTVPALEDKIVQMGVTRILNAIYEVNFMDCSYGYRKGRDCHMALEQLDNTIMTKPVNHVIDADTCAFFDNVNHEWMMKMLREKIADKNLLKLIRRFQKAGVMEDGKIVISDEAVPQGGLISPILSNIYLHYALDLWVEKIVKREAKGFVELIRYAVMRRYLTISQNISKYLCVS